MNDLTKLDRSETELLGELLSGRNKAIEISIPDDLPAKTVVKYTRSASSLLQKNEGEKAILIAVLGRLHYLARMNSEVLKEAGCETLADFERQIGGSGASRASIWSASAAYKAFPGLSPSLYATIGSVNLVIASKAFKQATPSQKAAALDKAAEMNTDQFREWVEESSGISSPGETSLASFTLSGTKAQIVELKEELSDQEFIIWAGTDQPLGMILAAIAESRSQFQAPKEDW